MTPYDLVEIKHIKIYQKDPAAITEIEHMRAYCLEHKLTPESNLDSLMRIEKGVLGYDAAYMYMAGLIKADNRKQGDKK
jgi:hypothetical protein